MNSTVCVSFAWSDPAQPILLEGAKLRFPSLPSTPGIYRLTLRMPDSVRVYIGETDNLARRAGNYRNPGPTQRTSQRINRELIDVMQRGGSLSLATAKDVALTLDGKALPVDLRLKPHRLLVENGALVELRSLGISQALNL